MDKQRHGPAVGTFPDMSRRPARRPGAPGPPGPDAPPVPMRLVIIDDHQMVLDGLKAMAEVGMPETLAKLKAETEGNG